jgi:hypothetical protein
MSRKFPMIAACALALIYCAPSHGQDSPSLGDLARQAQKDQKDKANKPPARVITNDDIPSKPAGGASPLSASPGAAVPPAGAGKSQTPESPAEGLARLQSQVDELDSLDRAALVRSVLEGNDSKFAGREKWEEKLFAAKQSFVAQNRAVLLQVKQIEAAAEGMKNVQDANDPRVKSMSAKLQALVQQTQQNAAAFQAVMSEGKALAANAGAK